MLSLACSHLDAPSARIKVFVLHKYRMKTGIVIFGISRAVHKVIAVAAVRKRTVCGYHGIAVMPQLAPDASGG